MNWFYKAFIKPTPSWKDEYYKSIGQAATASPYRVIWLTVTGEYQVQTFSDLETMKLLTDLLDHKRLSYAITTKIPGH